MPRRKRNRAPFSLFSFQDIITCVAGIVILVTLVLALDLSQRRQGSPKVQTASLTAQLREAIADAQAEVARLKAELASATMRAQELAGATPAMLRRDLLAIGAQIKSLNAELTLLEKQQADVAKEEAKLQAMRFDREERNQKIATQEKEIESIEEDLEQVQGEDRVFYNPRTTDGKQVWLVQIEADRTLIAAAGSRRRPKAFKHESSIFRKTSFENWLASRSTAHDFIFLLVKPEAIDEFNKIKTLLAKAGFAIGFDLLGDQQVAVDPEKGAAPP